MIRVLVAEDQAMVLGALGALIDIEQDLEVIGQVRSGTEALAAALSSRPDVIPLRPVQEPERPEGE